ncbi:MAG: sialidase family protein [Acidobacteriota bacterium]
MKATVTSLVCALALGSLPANAQTVAQNRGTDARVDYASLKQFGPWDDRNYQLTAEDLELLADNEKDLYVLVPAFFRVELRRERPNMLREGPVQYPRSSLPWFKNLYGGYLVDGRLYKAVRYQNGLYEVDTSAAPGVAEENWSAARFLDGEVRVTTPEGAAESAIAINPVNPDLVVAGTNGPLFGQTMHFSTDGGETWASAPNLTGNECCDPTVAWSSDGTKAYTATLGSTVWFYRSGDGGQTWTDLATITPGDDRREIGTGGVDKEYIHVDLFPTSAFLDRIYLSWHEGNVMFTSYSADRGNTWSAPNSFGTATNVRGIGSDLVTDKDGNVYHFWPAFNNPNIWVSKSEDGGDNWNANVEVAATQGSFDWPIPAMDSRFAWIYVSAGADLSDGPYGNSLYAAWTDTIDPEAAGANNNHTHIQVAYSRDGGDTWTVTTPHETDDGDTVDRFNQWLAVGPDGTVYVIFYDTRQDLPGRSDVDLYFSTSTDGAQTWGTPERLTSVTSMHISNGFEWGDYNGLDIVLNNLIAIYTDNRNEGGGGGDSVDAYAIGRTTGPADLIFADGFESGNTNAW